MKEKNYPGTVLKEEKVYKYKNNKGVEVDFILPAGTHVLDCEDETMAKIMDMNAKVNTAWLKGLITLEEINKICIEVWEG